MRTISQLFMKASLDDPRIQGVYINRVEMSQDKSVCYVLFCAHGGKQEFDEKLSTLILYKPSLRAALAKEINARYTPDLVFQFDESAEKSRKIDDIIENLKRKGEL